MGGLNQQPDAQPVQNPGTKWADVSDIEEEQNDYRSLIVKTGLEGTRSGGRRELAYLPCFLPTIDHAYDRRYGRLADALSATNPSPCHPRSSLRRPLLHSHGFCKRPQATQVGAS